MTEFLAMEILRLAYGKDSDGLLTDIALTLDAGETIQDLASVILKGKMAQIEREEKAMEQGQD